MELTDGQTAAVRYVVLETIQRRRHTGQPIPVWMRELLASVSQLGTETEPAQEDSITAADPIGTAEAATILRCSPRYVRRIAADLDGTRLSGRQYVFDRATVTEYATRRRENA
ncbi:hypothetical protein ACLQ3K_16135 [Tsukamurella sp. DT100]|uniref:hypothetical protein n=1 Tax=Tsukamurella sp. DT100 TaxID=3393415 RepID=UPI003CF45BEB